LEGTRWHLERARDDPHGLYVCPQGFKYTLPTLAIYHRPDADLLRVLRRYGVDFNTKDEDGLTPLMRAVGWFHCDLAGFRNVAGWMIDQGGADPNVRGGKRGETELHLAVQWFGPLDLVGAMRTLLAHGADPNVRDDLGRTPLHVIAGGYLGETYVPAMQVALSKGADPTLKNDEGDNCLATVARERNVQAMKLVLNSVPQMGTEQMIEATCTMFDRYSEERAYLTTWLGKAGQEKRQELEQRLLKEKSASPR